jgi:3-oxoacyl-[acyl-carrier-protein] synthase II
LSAIVVTGLGAVSGFGWGVEPLWRGLLANLTAIREFDRFDHARHRTHVAAQVPAPRPSEATAPEAWRRFADSHADRFALAASSEAWREAGLGSSPSRRVGVFFGSTTGGMFECERYFEDLTSRGHGSRRRPRLRDLRAQPTSAPADAVARALGARGPVQTVSSACAASGLAVARARAALAEGAVDVALAGGSDALCRLTYGGFNALRAVDARPCRPFRRDRDGLSLGEGAGVLVLERRSDALERGAEPLAVLAGVGASCDAHHMTAPDPSGRGVARAARAAMAEAAIEPAQVAFWNAHGTGTPLNDASEAAALALVFDGYSKRLPVTSNKGAFGHFLGAAGAIEAVVTVLALQRGVVPPTPGSGEPDPAAAVDLIAGIPRPWVMPERGPAAAISANFAFGGANVALVFQPWTA